MSRGTCEQVRGHILSLGSAFGGLAGGFEGAGGAAQDEGEHPGPWLWQGRQWCAAAAEGGRRVNRLEGTRALDEVVPDRLLLEDDVGVAGARVLLLHHTAQQGLGRDDIAL